MFLYALKETGQDHVVEFLEAGEQVYIQVKYLILCCVKLVVSSSVYD